ncbi:MAG: hypothetical protein JJ863_09930 [Deltaproteobacteria bacterium]|nr:hypothetical protein [Deltaproteobacteria bacterium]
MKQTLTQDDWKRVDTLLRRDDRLGCFDVIEQAAPDDFALGIAQQIVDERRRDLGLRLRPAIAEVTLDAVRQAAGPHAERVVAIEALWDGDTHGWFVVLLAITRIDDGDTPFGEVHLATLADEDGDARLFAGKAPSWPEAAKATEIGDDLAKELGVPFFFASPDSPDDEAERWWDTA